MPMICHVERRVFLRCKVVREVSKWLETGCAPQREIDILAYVRLPSASPDKPCYTTRLGTLSTSLALAKANPLMTTSDARFFLKCSFLVSCFHPQKKYISRLAQWLLRNARVCKGLKRTDNWLKHKFSVQLCADEFS